MLVGTSENNSPFYVKQGFDKYEKTIKNIFEEVLEKIRDIRSSEKEFWRKKWQM